MKRWSLFVKLFVLALVAVTVVFNTPSSFAYLAANSNIVENTFRIVARPPEDIVVPVTIHKTLVNLSSEEIGPGGFSFELLNLESQAAVKTTSMDNGYAFFHLSFTHEDIGKTFVYWLYEVNDGKENVTYDDTTYEIRITIGISEADELTADLTVDGNKTQEIGLEFENTYFVPVIPPETGDSAHPALWLVMMLSSAACLFLLKKPKGILA